MRVLPAGSAYRSYLACSPAAAQKFPTYNASTGTSFTLHTTMVDQATAETICNREGAHLASYTSLAEQVGMQRLACLALVVLHATPAPPASR